MTTPNIAVNDAWGTLVSGGAGAVNELMPEGGTDFLSVMDRTVNGQMPKAEDEVAAPVKTNIERKTPEARPESKAPEKKTENTDSSTGRESRDAKVESREAKKTAEDTSKAEVKDEVKETVVSKAESVKQQIILQLGITEKDLEAAMEILNIQAIDLLDPQIVPELVAQISGQDISAVLTDEDLYSSVTQITGMIRQNVAEVMQELDQTGAEFTETLEAIRGGSEVPAKAEEPVENVRFAQKQQPVENEKGFEKVKIEVESSLKDVVRTPAEANPERRTETDVTERKSVSDEPKIAGQSEPVEEKAPVEKETGRESRNDRHETDPKNNNNQNHFIQNLTQSVNDVVSGNERAEAVQPYVRAEQIIEQIENSIRVGLNEDSTSMELQLHPASLGKINVKLVSANGEVTAQFEAQNASVKAALEGHVAQLKETLQNQGVKIESVEVTVASHEFEQNLMQGQDQNASNARDGKGTRMRRINLNEEDDEIDGIGNDADTEAERIARSMMAANGTSVDLQA
ncbi:MAG: flagellar hook-length control protein FliK [Lachnospiraceae bacterium]|nr:flagellar hook-length control protein FliK [Lachnospiraceae bacterium]